MRYNKTPHQKIVSEIHLYNILNCVTYISIYLLCFISRLANDELLRAFGKSKEGNTRVIKASIEKGN